MLFVVHCTDKPNHMDVRLANRSAHLDYARANIDKFIVGGPTLTEDGQGMTGSLLILDFPDRTAVEDFCAKDPYAIAGLFESVVILPYKKVLP
jgi:uncharacterized protein YciI